MPSTTFPTTILRVVVDGG